MQSAIKFYVSTALAATTCLATCQKVSDVGNLKLKEGEISASKACEVASKVAEGFGLGKFATKDYEAVLRPINGNYSQDYKGPREWCLYYPNGSRGFSFRVDTRTSELLGYEDWNLTWPQRNTKPAKLGFYAATKRGLRGQIIKHLDVLGIKAPAFMFLNCTYDHQGALRYDSLQSPEASFYANCRHYSLILDRTTGKLAKLEISPKGSSEDAVHEDYKTKVDYSKALAAAVDFCQRIGFADVTKDQIYGSLLHINASHVWVFTHNRVTLQIDPLTNAVTDFYNMGIEERYQKGDRMIATDAATLKVIVSKVGDKLNIDPKAQLDARAAHTWSKFGMSDLPVLQGTYRIGKKEVARLTFDFYKGEIISIKLNPNGLGPMAIL